MNRAMRVFGAAVAGAVLAASCSPRAEQAHRQAAPVMPVIAYLPDYRLDAVAPAVYGSLTDLIFFSIEPTRAGGLDLGRLPPETLRKLRGIKGRAHIRLLVALGGWDRSKGFGPMATDGTARGRFVQALTQFCRKNGFDGAEFDREHPANAVEENAYVRLLVETKQAFQPHGLLVTVALAPWQKLGADAWEAVDRVHLMAYDHEGRHSTFEDARADVDGLAGQGVPRSKICLGVPFYGREIAKPDQAMAYAEIVRRYRPAPEVDEAGGLFFNGIRTIQRKARYAMESHLGGLMIWELAQDTSDDTSLLRAIHEIVWQ
jgi:GH18 family chitinase